jgi:23S rRNA pseudouridine1911/1915/1917 synthase
MHNEIEWCSLNDAESVESILKETFKLSGQKIKQSQLSKNYLKKKVFSRDCLRFPIELINYGEIYPLYHGAKVIVLKETQEFLAIHKPPAVHTHPQRYEEVANLLSWLSCNGFAHLNLVNANQHDRGALWRLDFETSGVVVIAKNDETYKKVRSDFQHIVKKKYYWAVVSGVPKSQKLINQLEKSGPKGERVKVSSTGEEVSLSFETLLTQNSRSLVLIELHHGYRHQIRVQMSALGFPLLGDTFYGGESAERLYLHCWRYELGTEIFQDNHAELFDNVIDLDRLLKMLNDKFF